MSVTTAAIVVLLTCVVRRKIRASDEAVMEADASSSDECDR
ncbi:hypothetical protein [Haladaptatus sp. NG-WS-4]